MSPVRLDRTEIRIRLAEHPAWVVDEMLDRFEGAALRALDQARTAEAAIKAKGAENE